jgi:hypothetical protein
MGWPTTTGRESVAHPARVNPSARQAMLPAVSLNPLRTMVFMGATPLLKKPNWKNKADAESRRPKVAVAGHSGVTSYPESWAQFS